MKIELFTDLTVELDDGELIKVSVRDLTSKEEKEFQKKIENIVSASRKVERIKRKIKNIERKLDVLKDEKKIVKLIDEMEALEEEKDSIDDEFVSSGMDTLNDLYKEKFELVISGDGKDRLREVAEIRGFEKLLTLISKEKENEDKEGN